MSQLKAVFDTSTVRIPLFWKKSKSFQSNFSAKKKHCKLWFRRRLSYQELWIKTKLNAETSQYWELISSFGISGHSGFQRKKQDQRFWKQLILHPQLEICFWELHETYTANRYKETNGSLSSYVKTNNNFWKFPTYNIATKRTKWIIYLNYIVIHMQMLLIYTLMKVNKPTVVKECQFERRNLLAVFDIFGFPMQSTNGYFLQRLVF